MQKKLNKFRENMNPFSQKVILSGFYLLDICYLLALLIHKFTPLFDDYLAARNIFYGALETGPALFSAAVCAGVICDFIFRHYTSV